MALIVPLYYERELQYYEADDLMLKYRECKIMKANLCVYVCVCMCVCVELTFVLNCIVHFESKA